MVCITGARMTMKATVIRGNHVKTETGTTPSGGHFESQEDPITGDIPEVIDSDGHVVEFDVPCLVTAFTDTGYRTASNTEEFDKGVYRIYEYLEMRFPPNFTITRRDTVTAIRDARTGKALWVEEEALLVDDKNDSTKKVYPATDYDVVGVNPVFDPFGSHIENLTVIKRSEVQSGRD